MHRGEKETLRAEKSCETHTGCYRTWSKTLESLANPLESLRVRLQAAPRSIAERSSELGVLLVHYSKPRSAHSDQHISVIDKRDNGRAINLRNQISFLKILKCIEHELTLILYFFTL